MNTTELLAVFRAEVFDLTEPYLWADESVYGYIDDAQKQFCRDTYGIADARSFTLTIAPEVSWYTLDPRILKLRDVLNTSTGYDIPVVPIEKMASEGMRFDGARGPIRALVSGLEENVLRAWPVPNEALSAELRTFRLPADVEAGDDLEISPRHHVHLLNWVKHRAYSVQDAETHDKDASEKFRGTHAAYCAAAKVEQSRAMHTAGAVAYGGI
jgi:hypothetical protein